MAEIIEGVSNRPVIDGNFVRDLWAGKSIKQKFRPLMAFMELVTAASLHGMIFIPRMMRDFPTNVCELVVQLRKSDLTLTTPT